MNRVVLTLPYVTWSMHQFILIKPKTNTSANRYYKSCLALKELFVYKRDMQVTKYYKIMRMQSTCDGKNAVDSWERPISS